MWVDPVRDHFFTPSALGSGWQAIVHPDDLDRVMRTYQRTIQHQTCASYWLRVVSANGTTMLAHVTMKPIFDNGVCTGFRGATRLDTSQQQRPPHQTAEAVIESVGFGHQSL